MESNTTKYFKGMHVLYVTRLGKGYNVKVYENDTLVMDKHMLSNEVSAYKMLFRAAGYVPIYE